MTIVGYARVSSAGQSLEIQQEQLTQAGCEKLFSEKQSGTSTNNRMALQDALEWLREGDTLVVRSGEICHSASDPFGSCKFERFYVRFAPQPRSFRILRPLPKSGRSRLDCVIAHAHLRGKISGPQSLREILSPKH